MHPESLPPDLLAEVQKVAQQTGLSVAETIDESRALGFPKFRETLSPDPRTNLKPPNLLVANLQTGMSLERIACQCIKLGLPILVAQLWVEPLPNLQPLTEEESRRCFQTPHPEFDALAAHCASLPVPIPEDK